MKVLDRITGLRMWQKLSIIVLALGVPAIVLAVFYIGSMSYDGRFAQAELDGLEFVEPVDRLIALISTERTLVENAVKPGAPVAETSRRSIEETRLKIDETMKQIDEADRKYGSKFGTTEKWKSVRADWTALKDGGTSLKPEEIPSRYDRLTADLLAVHTDVSEKSNLILDPILVTYYMQDNLTLRVLPVIETFSQARVLAFENASRGSMSPESRDRLAMLLGQISAARAGFDGNITILKDRDPATYESLAPRYTEAATAADQFTALLRKTLTNPEKAADVTSEEVWQKGTTALNAYLAVNEADAPLLRAKLTSRSQAANTRIYVSAAFISLALLFAGSLVYSIAYGITRQTTEITNTFAAVKAGHATARAQVLLSDELGQMPAEHNATLVATAALIQSQDERDQIQKSIMKLLDEVGGVAQGDLTAEAEVTADMTGAIADAFNYMIDQLRQIIGSVQRATLQVTESAGEIFESTRKLASGAEGQAMKIVGTTRAVEEMALSVRQVSENATESAAVAHQALENARQGNESVKNTIAGMDRIRDQVQETAKRMKRLGESSQEIGQIIQLIDDIADRTSILALNASIQAAMAGEAGRGFAVVAEEVERLADRSTDATKKIATLVKAIQSETNEAVTAMEKGIHEVVEGSRLATQAGQALQEIESVSSRLAGLIEQISDASSRQAAASDGVTRAMTEINGITKQTATGTHHTAAAVQSLAELAEELRASVATFKLPGSPAVLPPEANGPIDFATELFQDEAVHSNGSGRIGLVGSRF